jgi:hypothetical protein
METTETSSGYRPVSGLAVAALVMGVLSALALTSPLLWGLPLLGVLLAVVALRDVSREGAEKAGRAAALAGLALAIGFGMQALTGRLVARWLMADRARAVTAAWLDAIRDGKLVEARGMVAPDLLPSALSFDRPPQPDDAPPDPPEAEFARLPVVAEILRCGGRAAREISCEEIQPPEGPRWVTVVRLSPCAEGGAVAVRLELEPRDQREKTGRVQRWLVTKLEIER